MNLKKIFGLALIVLMVSFLVGCEKNKNESVVVHVFDIYCFAPYEGFEGKEVAIMSVYAKDVEFNFEEDELLFQGVSSEYFYPKEHREDIGPTESHFEKNDGECVSRLPNYWKTLMIIQAEGDISEIKVYHRSLKTDKFRLSSETVVESSPKGSKITKEKIYKEK